VDLDLFAVLNDVTRTPFYVRFSFAVCVLRILDGGGRMPQVVSARF
jgi:hypothetical protein